MNAATPIVPPEQLATVWPAVLPWISEAVERNQGDENIWDVLIAISGSGNSPNILCAVKWAKRNGLATLGITGFDGGKLRRMAQHKLHVPLNDMCTAESIHSVLLHYIVLALAERIHGKVAWH